MKKILKLVSLIVISLFTLSIFGWMVFHISEGDKKFGFITGTIKFMYTFPDLFSQSVEEVKSLPHTFLPTPGDFKSINKLDFDVFVLTAYSDTNDSRSIVLMNLKNDSILYKWAIENPFAEHDRIKNQLLLSEKSVVYSFDGNANLQRIDSLTNTIWKQDSIVPHHTMNLDKNGDIWICSAESIFDATGMYKLNGRSVFYADNYISKVDAETGRILFHKSITEILKENKLESYLIKSEDIKDPFHINDVQPALKSTQYYEEDDLFISSRHLSLIMHYRPSTNKVINILEGPFSSQHDVDFLDDNTLVFFNNNHYSLWPKASMNPPADSSKLKIAGDFYSNMVSYDFSTGSFSSMGDSIFRENKIFTATEGLLEFINPTTYLVEEQNSGIIWIIQNDTVLYKNVIKSQHEGYHHYPNWIRIIKQYD